MFYLRKSSERGHANFGWLDTNHTFSFADYHDDRHMGFGPLRVINEDRVVGGGGFSTHGHRDMEIVSYVISGELEHQDTLGTKSLIKPQEIQKMSAGTGIRHSEYNASATEPVHFLQIWIIPDTKSVAPGYEQAKINFDSNQSMVFLASKDNSQSLIHINQDVNLYAARWKKDQQTNIKVIPGRKVWIQMVRGELNVNGQILRTSDGLGISDENELSLTAQSEAEFLFFDMLGFN